jgi:hypothetical protein
VAGALSRVLAAASAMQDLQFFSFEHYPDGPCRITCGSLYDKPELIHHVVDVWHNDELPASVPFYIMEWNLSSSTSQTYEDIFGGLWLADYIGSFLIPLSVAATRAGLQRLCRNLRDVHRTQRLLCRSAVAAVLCESDDQSGMAAGRRSQSDLCCGVGCLRRRCSCAHHPPTPRSERMGDRL